MSLHTWGYTETVRRGYRDPSPSELLSESYSSPFSAHRRLRVTAVREHAFELHMRILCGLCCWVDV